MSELWDFSAPEENEHPSELMMDQLHAGEIEASEAAALHEHIDGCGDCAAEFRALGAHFDGIAAVDSRRLLAAIRREVDKPRGFIEQLAASWRKCTIGLLAVGGVTAAALFFMQTEQQTGQTLPVDPGLGGVRMKGTGVLHVMRKTQSGAEELAANDTVAAGDELRFVVDLHAEGRIKIIGIEASGTLYTAWPASGPGKTLPRKQGQALVGAVTLDASPGKETLYLVHCPTAVKVLCTTAGADSKPNCPTGCTLDAFVLNKAVK